MTKKLVSVLASAAHLYQRETVSLAAAAAKSIIA